MNGHTTAIEVTGITKSYGDQQVLRGLDLTVPAGTVYALLGPNGAGKTTMVRILSTLMRADDGRARVAGFDVRTEPDGVRRSIGVTGQFSAIDALLTGRENLRLMADLAHLPGAAAAARVDELLARFDLTAAADRRAATYSGGMQRRLDLAMTLVSRPRVIFLDEPTSGLDPRSRRELWQVVAELLVDGVTVFLTTQYLEEADRLAHTVGQHRRRIARLATGDSLALPAEVLPYLEKLRTSGAPEPMVEGERDAWILMAARWPERIPEFMVDKTAQLDDPRMLQLNRLIGELLEVGMDEGRLIAMADLLAEMAEQSAQRGELDRQRDQLGDDAFVALLDAFAFDAHPMVERLQELMAERGWTGWIRIERAAETDPSPESRP
jgi:ABC-2 type transport system ATP-binding protein